MSSRAPAGWRADNVGRVSLRPTTGPSVLPAFLKYHPPAVFHFASPEQRRCEMERAGLVVEAFEPLAEWAVSLLRQRVQALRLLESCASQTFGREPYTRILGTLTSAADEYERGSITPTLLVARSPA